MTAPATIFSVPFYLDGACDRPESRTRGYVGNVVLGAKPELSSGWPPVSR